MSRSRDARRHVSVRRCDEQPRRYRQLGHACRRHPARIPMDPVRRIRRPRRRPRHRVERRRHQRPGRRGRLLFSDQTYTARIFVAPGDHAGSQPRHLPDQLDQQHRLVGGDVAERSRVQNGRRRRHAGDRPVTSAARSRSTGTATPRAGRFTSTTHRIRRRTAFRVLGCDRVGRLGHARGRGELRLRHQRWCRCRRDGRHGGRRPARVPCAARWSDGGSHSALGGRGRVGHHDAGDIVGFSDTYSFFVPTRKA